MIDKELLSKVQHIQIYTSRLVNDLLAGEYHSTFKGRGIEFDAVREYIPGDEIRTIDWKVTARMGKPFIKKFVEERELTIMLMVDVSASGQFGTRNKFKNDLSAELCAVLAFSAIKNNDKVGLILFSDYVEKYIPPKKGKQHVLRVITELLSFKPKGKHTNINATLKFLNSVNKRRTVCFLLSDFLCEDYERALQISNKRHDIIALSIEDPAEVEIPKVGWLNLQDAETGESIFVNTFDKNFQKEFKILTKKEKINRDKIFRKIGVDVIQISTNKSYVEPLMRFFRTRESRR